MRNAFEWTRAKVPVEARQALRYLVGAARDGYELLSGREEPDLPPHRLRSVGFGDFRSIGETMVGHFIDPGQLQRDDDVLDIGCGIGRMAIPLTKYLSSAGSYQGLDIRPAAIRWCRDHITARHPNFRFDCVELSNTLYARRAAGDPAQFEFPYPTGSFDFVIATSLFTHMLPSGTSNYLEEINRVLRPGGRAFTTWFVLNEATMSGAADNVGVLRFEVDRGDYAVDSERVPEAALAYKEAVLRRMLAAARLTIEEPIHFGSWSGVRNPLDLQDIVIAVTAGPDHRAD
jgi:SAM-dependent methyltransferase